MGSIILYCPFGELIYEENAFWMLDTIPRYLFNGKELDEESGMYYYSARYYAPPTFISRDPLFEKYPFISPYAYCSNNPVNRIDPDGRDWYYAEDGTCLGKDNKKTDNVFAVKDGSYTARKGGGYTIKMDGATQLTDANGDAVNHNEFQQMAATVYNETYADQDVDKYRVASAIMNRQEANGKTLQKTLDNISYNNDSHEDRMKNKRKVSGTDTESYAKFFNTSTQNRNKNSAMQTSAAATINALLPNAIDYTMSADGNSKATQWRGGIGKTNRYFTNYPTSSSNQITNFKYNEIYRKGFGGRCVGYK